MVQNVQHVCFRHILTQQHVDAQLVHWVGHTIQHHNNVSAQLVNSLLAMLASSAITLDTLIWTLDNVWVALLIKYIIYKYANVLIVLPPLPYSMGNNVLNVLTILTMMRTIKHVGLATMGKYLTLQACANAQPIHSGLALNAYNAIILDILILILNNVWVALLTKSTI